MRALFDTLELTAIQPHFEDFLDAAERKAALPAHITVASDRPLRAADELLARAQQLDPDAVDLPIDVERLANLCGVRVIPFDFGQQRTDDEGLSGLLIELDDGPVIGVQKARYKPRSRFTVAHELGHHLLRHHSRFHVDLTTLPSEGHSTSALYDPRLEREANDLAANLLMPATLVRNAYSTSTSAKELAERFGVSPLAMSYRLVNLGLKDSVAPSPP